MAETKSYPPGTFCWIELATPDPAGAKKFYREIMGWDSKDNPMPDGANYTMLSLGKDGVGGAYKITKEMIEMHVPPHWACYVSVVDAAASAKKARELGATIVKDTFDVMDAGRMAVITDPTGATFCLWQAKSHQGAAQVPMGTPGAACWYELLTPNVDRAVGFYGKLFGWTPKPMDMGGMPYTVATLGEQQLCGIISLPEEMQKQHVPAHWMVYFAVKDCDASVQKAKKLGAKVLNGPMDIPTVGRVATLQDPQGAAFSFHQPAAK